MGSIDLHGLQKISIHEIATALIGNDQKGLIRTASAAQRENNPIIAGITDGSFLVLNLMGLNHLDNAISAGLNPNEERGAFLREMSPLLTPIPVKGAGIRANQKAGAAREAVEQEILEKANPGASVQGQQFLRDSQGKIVKDPVTGQGRKIDHVVIKDKQAIDVVETTSQTANKGAQIRKEERIRNSGGTFVKDRTTKELIDVSKTPTRISRHD